MNVDVVYPMTGRARKIDDSLRVPDPRVGSQPAELDLWAALQNGPHVERFSL
jgi:hypothetical protein